MAAIVAFHVTENRRLEEFPHGCGAVPMAQQENRAKVPPFQNIRACRSAVGLVS